MAGLEREGRRAALAQQSSALPAGLPVACALPGPPRTLETCSVRPLRLIDCQNLGLAVTSRQHRRTMATRHRSSSDRCAKTSVIRCGSSSTAPAAAACAAASYSASSAPAPSCSPAHRGAKQGGHVSSECAGSAAPSVQRRLCNADAEAPAPTAEEAAPARLAVRWSSRSAAAVPSVRGGSQQISQRGEAARVGEAQGRRRLRRPPQQRCGWLGLYAGQPALFGDPRTLTAALRHLRPALRLAASRSLIDGLVGRWVVVGGHSLSATPKPPPSPQRSLAAFPAVRRDRGSIAALKEQEAAKLTGLLRLKKPSMKGCRCDKPVGRWSRRIGVAEAFNRPANSSQRHPRPSPATFAPQAAPWRPPPLAAPRRCILPPFPGARLAPPPLPPPPPCPAASSGGRCASPPPRRRRPPPPPLRRCRTRSSCSGCSRRAPPRGRCVVSGGAGSQGRSGPSVLFSTKGELLPASPRLAARHLHPTRSPPASSPPSTSCTATTRRRCCRAPRPAPRPTLWQK